LFAPGSKNLATPLLCELSCIELRPTILIRQRRRFVTSLRRRVIFMGEESVGGWITLGWISRRLDVGIWTGLGLPRIETGGGRL